MIRRMLILVGLLSVLLLIDGYGQKRFDINARIEYCVQKAEKTLAVVPSDAMFPRNIAKEDSSWHYVGIRDWTSGFWPGILWYLYEDTGDDRWKQVADRFTKALKPLAYSKSFSHDLGFMLHNSFGNGWRSTHNPAYKEVLLAAADSLATLFNPKVGTILSWPGMVGKMGWPHNTIIDNMMNLELLFWAEKNGGEKRLYDIAVRHAETTMKNQFRPDYSNYHVVVYDTATGNVIKRITHQGYSDSSMWARGQAWAIYGFTMVYRETQDRKFLDFAQQVSDIYLKRLPADMIPFWDFDAPRIPGEPEPKDASAAAISASALLELSNYVKKNKAKTYHKAALKMLDVLSSENFQRGDNMAFLLYSTGHKPENGEVDVPIIYADYYYLEALLRLKKLSNHQSLFNP